MISISPGEWLSPNAIAIIAAGCAWVVIQQFVNSDTTSGSFKKCVMPALVTAFAAFLLIGGSLGLRVALIAGVAQSIRTVAFSSQNGADPSPVRLLTAEAAFLFVAVTGSRFLTEPPPETKPDSVALLVLLSGAVYATWISAPIVGAFLEPFRQQTATGNTPNAGTRIGLLERTLVYCFVVAGHPAAAGP